MYQRSRNLRTVGVAFLLYSGLLLGSPANAEPSTVVAAISDVQVKLFYENSGRFSANLATKRDVTLWNVVIGEGGVDGPSDNTLLLITVAGPPKNMIDKLRLRVTASTPKGEILSHDASVGIFNTSGNWYAPVLLYDTGCEPVTVKAQLLLDKTEGAPVTFTIPFACGE